jgi:integrase
VHPHTLRHSCGYALANKGHDIRVIQDYLGHRDPRHTAHYTRGLFLFSYGAVGKRDHLSVDSLTPTSANG